MIIVTALRTHAAATKTEELVAGRVGMEAAFHFSPEWDGLGKTAVFEAGAVAKDVLIGDDPCIVPHECMIEGAELRVGIYGMNYDGSIVIPTVYAHIGTVKKGADPSGDESYPPSPDVGQQAAVAASQALQAASDARDATLGANNAAADAQAAAENAQAAATGANNAAQAAQSATDAAKAAAKTAQDSAYNAQNIAAEIQSKADNGEFDGAQGPAGEDGGYYVPYVTRPDNSTTRIHFVGNKSDMPYVEAVDLEIPHFVGTTSTPVPEFYTAFSKKTPCFLLRSEAGGGLSMWVAYDCNNRYARFYQVTPDGNTRFGTLSDSGFTYEEGASGGENNVFIGDANTTVAEFYEADQAGKVCFMKRPQGGSGITTWVAYNCHSGGASFYHVDSVGIVEYGRLGSDGSWNYTSAKVDVDTTLTQSGKAADAKAVGDALEQKQDAGNYLTDHNTFVGGVNTSSAAFYEAFSARKPCFLLRPDAGRGMVMWVAHDCTSRAARFYNVAPDGTVRYATLEGLVFSYESAAGGSGNVFVGDATTTVAEFYEADQAGKVCFMKRPQGGSGITTWVAYNCHSGGASFYHVDSVGIVEYGRLGSDGSWNYTSAKVDVVKSVNGITPDPSGKVTLPIPTTLPNPHKLTFSGAVNAEYDGSEAVEVVIPQGGGGSGASDELEVIADVIFEKNTSEAVFSEDSSGQPFLLKKVVVEMTAEKENDSFYPAAGHTIVFNDYHKGFFSVGKNTPTADNYLFSFPSKPSDITTETYTSHLFARWELEINEIGVMLGKGRTGVMYEDADGNFVLAAGAQGYWDANTENYFTGRVLEKNGISKVIVKFNYKSLPVGTHIVVKGIRA